MADVGNSLKKCPANLFRPIIQGKFIHYIIAGALVLSVAFALFLICYMAYKAKEINGLYHYIKSNGRGWRGNPYISDPTLGMKPKPGAEAAEIYPSAPPVPARFSELGFRIPVGEANNAGFKRPLFLSLGCSFTYGSSCLAEETYTHLIARHFHGQGLNAGVGSYGLAQIHVLAAELIPRYKPDHVIVQYSPWLVERAQTGYLPTYFGKLPSPYFFIDATGALAIHPAYYKTIIFSFDFDRFRRTRPGLLDKIGFFAGIGLPLALHDDGNELWVKIKKNVCLLPEPIQDRSKILFHVYRNLVKICNDNNARVYILAMDSIDLNEDISRYDKELLAGLAGAELIDTTPALRRKLHPGKNPIAEYGHFHDGILVDVHPNALAHVLYAQELINKIELMEPGRQ